MPAQRTAIHPPIRKRSFAGLRRRTTWPLFVSSNDILAQHIHALVWHDVTFDPIENTIVALQRAGILSRTQAVRLQARYLREGRP